MSSVDENEWGYLRKYIVMSLNSESPHEVEWCVGDASVHPANCLAKYSPEGIKSRPTSSPYDVIDRVTNKSPDPPTISNPGTVLVLNTAESLSEITSTNYQRFQWDYICGVLTKLGHICLETIQCKVHSFALKLLIRSAPLPELFSQMQSFPMLHARRHLQILRFISPLNHKLAIFKGKKPRQASSSSVSSLQFDPDLLSKEYVHQLSKTTTNRVEETSTYISSRLSRLKRLSINARVKELHMRVNK